MSARRPVQTTEGKREILFDRLLAVWLKCLKCSAFLFEWKTSA